MILFSAALLKRARIVKRFLEKANHTDRVVVRPKEVFEQEEALRWMQTVVGPGLHKVSTEISADRPIQMKDRGLFGNPVVFSSNGIYYIALCYWKARVEIEGYQLKARFGDCQIWSLLAIENPDTEEFRAAYEEFSQFCTGRAKGTLLMRQLDWKGGDD